MTARSYLDKGIGTYVCRHVRTVKSVVNLHIHFFTSANLMIDLAKMGLYGYGTMRRNRKGFPQSLKKISKQGMKERGASKTV